MHGVIESSVQASYTSVHLLHGNDMQGHQALQRSAPAKRLPLSPERLPLSDRRQKAWLCHVARRHARLKASLPSQHIILRLASKTRAARLCGGKECNILAHRVRAVGLVLPMHDVAGSRVACALSQHG